MNISLSLLCAFIFEWSTSIASEKGEPNVIPTGYTLMIHLTKSI
jgi:hypothetical protein